MGTERENSNRIDAYFGAAEILIFGAIFMATDALQYGIDGEEGRTKLPVCSTTRLKRRGKISSVFTKKFYDLVEQDKVTMNENDVLI